jgi:hypothetical protein
MIERLSISKKDERKRQLEEKREQKKLEKKRQLEQKKLEKKQKNKIENNRFFNDILDLGF